MANICCTDYTVIQKNGDREQLERLYEVMVESEKMDKEHPMWMGNIVRRLEGDSEKIRCDGWWLDTPTLENGILHFTTESRWGELYEVREYLESIFPDLKFYYQSDIPESDLFFTNDVDGEHYPDCFYLDVGGSIECFRTIRETAKYVEKLVEHSVWPQFKAIEEELTNYCEKKDDGFIFARYKLVDDDGNSLGYRDGDDEEPLETLF